MIKQNLWNHGKELYQKMIDFENSKGSAKFDINNWLMCSYDNPYVSEYINTMKQYFSIKE